VLVGTEYEFGQDLQQRLLVESGNVRGGIGMAHCEIQRVVIHVRVRSGNGRVVRVGRARRVGVRTALLYHSGVERTDLRVGVMRTTLKWRATVTCSRAKVVAWMRS